MQIRLWGVRGSLPSPISNHEYTGKLNRILDLAIKNQIKKAEDIDKFLSTLPDELRYVFGGDTTCVTVKSNSGKLYIIDCGTGIDRQKDILYYNVF